MIPRPPGNQANDPGGPSLIPARAKTAETDDGSRPGDDGCFGAAPSFASRGRLRMAPLNAGR